MNIHSDDAAVLWLPESRTLLAGDTLEDTVTFVDEPESLEAHLGDLDRLKALGAERILPAHGDPGVIAGGGYPPGFIDATQAYIRRLISCREDRALRDVPLREFVADSLAEGSLVYHAPYETVHRDNVAKVAAHVKPVRIGCSGWVYKDWRGSFYPEKMPQRLWLEHYSSVFGTVEINNTFYRLPSEAAVKGWAEQTPGGFEFAVKGSRYTTHIKRLLSFDKYSTRFFKALEPLEKPGSSPSSSGSCRRTSARTSAGWRRRSTSSTAGRARHCFEFRHETWFKKDTYDLLRAHDAALVTGDDPRFPFVTREVTASWAYVRFHRGAHGVRGKYAPGELDTWRRRIAAWRRKDGRLRLLQQRLGRLRARQRAGRWPSRFEAERRRS